jgi:hypothetical protein
MSTTHLTHSSKVVVKTKGGRANHGESRSSFLNQLPLQRQVHQLQLTGVLSNSVFHPTPLFRLSSHILLTVSNRIRIKSDRVAITCSYGRAATVLAMALSEEILFLSHHNIHHYMQEGGWSGTLDRLAIELAIPSILLHI